jgi:hypothetical protein
VHQAGEEVEWISAFPALKKYYRRGVTPDDTHFDTLPSVFFFFWYEFPYPNLICSESATLLFYDAPLIDTSDSAL